MICGISGNKLNVEKNMTETKEKMNKKKVAVIAVLAIIAMTVIGFGIFYGKKIEFYTAHFLPSTTVNGMNCSELDAATVAEMLNEQAKEYQLTIYGRDENGRQMILGVLDANVIGLEMADALGQASEVLNTQDPSRFLHANEESYSYLIVPVITFDETLLAKALEKLEAFQEKNMIVPVDAYVSDCSEEEKGFQIIAEVMGTTLDTKKAFSVINAAIVAGAETVDLLEQGCYEEPAILSDDAGLVAEAELLNKWVGSKITYDWNTNEVVVDAEIIKDWIVRTEDSISLDKEAIADFVAANAKKYDTYGKTRQFTTTLGVELTLGTGGFGWQTDRDAVTAELIKMIEDGKVAKVEPAYSNKAPKKGMNDIGNSYVEIDLSNQHLYLYIDGTNVFETEFVSGAMNSTPRSKSPAGVFDITYKTTNAILRGSDYAEPVSYWMPFYGNYGMHDATWRTEFGGDIFMTNGSHGCINLPLDSAAVIYNYVKTGFPVICYYY